MIAQNKRYFKLFQQVSTLICLKWGKTRPKMIGFVGENGNQKGKFPFLSVLLPICIEFAWADKKSVALPPRFDKIRLTAGGFVRYNAKLQGYTPERRVFHAENIPAEEAPQKKGAWVQKKNV